MPINIDLSASFIERAALLNRVKLLSYPYRRDLSPLDSPCLKYFLISIDAYIEAKGVINPDEIIEKCFLQGYEYAEYLKRLRYVAWTRSIGAELFERPEWYDKIVPPLIGDIGDIFNYNFLIPWLEPEPEDFKFYSIPVTTKKETVDEFRYFAEDLISQLDFGEEVLPDEILLTSSGSYSFNGIDLEKNYLIKERKQENIMGNRIGSCKRTVITVGPQNYRDTVILSLPALNRVKWIEQQVQSIIEQIPENAMVRNPEEFQRRLDSLRKNNRFFLMRDIKKEGITKPRYLLRIVLELLYKYSGFEAFKATDFYDSFDVEDDNYDIKALRGHGLGMANALTSLIQVIVLRQIQSRIALESRDLEFLVYNDDFIGASQDRQLLEAYWDEEDIVLEELSIIREPKKSYFTEHAGVLCENYFWYPYQGINDKKSYKIREILLAFSAENITHAKMLISSSINSVYEYIDDYIQEIVSFWGYEFFENEVEYPTIVGGWFSSAIANVRLDLIELDNLPYDIYLTKAYNACKNNQIIMVNKGSRRTFNAPVNYLYPISFIEEEYRDIFNVTDMVTLRNMFSRPSLIPERIQFFWNKLYERRQNDFKKSYAPQMKEDLFQEILENSPTFYPPDRFVEKYIDVDFREPTIDPYVSRNPKLSYLAIDDFNARKGDIIGERYSIKFINSSIFKTLPSDFRKRLGKYINLKYLNLPGIQEDKVFCLYPRNPEDEQGFLNSTEEPQNLAIAARILRPDGRFPIIKERYRSPLVNLKREVFGRILTYDELDSISKTDWSRKSIKKVISENSPEDLKIKIEILLEYSVSTESAISYEGSESSEESVYSDHIKNIDELREIVQLCNEEESEDEEFDIEFLFISPKPNDLTQRQTELYYNVRDLLQAVANAPDFVNREEIIVSWRSQFDEETSDRVRARVRSFYEEAPSADVEGFFDEEW